MFNKLWFHRNLIIRNGLRDLYIRYVGSFFGVLWNVLQPLSQILIFTIVFSKIMLAKIPGLSSASSYAIYLCAGLLPWLSFSETISRCAFSISENASILKKLPIPEEVFVVQNLISMIVSLFISMFLLILLMLFLGYNPSISWCVIPMILIMLELFALGIGIFFSGIYVFFKDIGQIINIFLQLWMWLTPIVYVKEILPGYFQKIFLLNPLYYFIEALQKCILYGRVPSVQRFLIMAGISLASVWAGSMMLQKLKEEIRDVI